MSYGLKLKTGPVIQPISVNEVKTHLRIDTTVVDEEMDISIDGMIKAAREYCEAYQNRSYNTQTWQLVLDRWPSDWYIELPRPPLISVTSITYLDSISITPHTMPITDYSYDTSSFSGRVALGYSKIWPTETLRPGGAITIEYVAGYGATGSTVPFMAHQAMLLLIGHWWENREAVLTSGSMPKEIQFALTSLLDMEKVY